MKSFASTVGGWQLVAAAHCLQCFNTNPIGQAVKTVQKIHTEGLCGLKRPRELGVVSAKNCRTDGRTGVSLSEESADFFILARIQPGQGSVLQFSASRKRSCFVAWTCEGTGDFPYFPLAFTAEAMNAGRTCAVRLQRRAKTRGWICFAKRTFGVAITRSGSVLRDFGSWIVSGRVGQRKRDTTLPPIVAGPAKPGQVRKEAALRPRCSGACGGSVVSRRYGQSQRFPNGMTLASGQAHTAADFRCKFPCRFRPNAGKCGTVRKTAKTGLNRSSRSANFPTFQP